MEKPTVSVIILNWNGLEDTIKCLESLSQITYSNYSVIVVDNASKGNDVEVLKSKFGDYIKVIQNDTNYGYAIANNIGIENALKSGYEYVLILNNDLIVDPEFLDELINLAETDPTIGIVGPKTYYMDKPSMLYTAGGILNRVNMYFGQHWMRGHNKIDNGKYDKNYEVDFLAGACILLKKETILKAGTIPTEFFLQWEDIDYCVQIRKSGFKCMYAYKSKIWHKVGSSFKRHNQNYNSVQRGIRNRFIFSKKNLSKPELASFVLLFSFVTIPVYISYYLFVYNDMTRIRSLMKGYFEGIKIICHNDITYT